jgi:hypothetical protein
MRSPLPNKVVDFFICIIHGEVLSLYCGNMRTDEDGWRRRIYLHMSNIILTFALQ